MAGNFDYDRKKKRQSSVGGKLAVFLLWREIFITTGKKKIHNDRKKKRYSRLSDGCAVLVIMTGKKGTAVCLMGAHVRCTRPKKLVSSDFAKILNVANKIRETCEKTLFTPSSPIHSLRVGWRNLFSSRFVVLC